MQIAIGKIIPNPDNPRKDFDPATLEELSSSIRQHGLLNPIAVEENNGVYILIDGERRWRAAKLAGWAEIPAEVRERTNNIQRLMLALVANLQREDMNPIDEARAFEQLKKAGMSNTKIAHQLGVSIPKVVSRLKLLGIDEEIQDLIAARVLPCDERVVDALKLVPNSEARVRLARRVARPGVPIKAIQTAAARLAEQMRTEQGIAPDGHSPSLALAEQRRKTVGQPPRWSALKQLGKVPRWELVAVAANEACDRCSLRDVASAKTCAECPAVFLLESLIEAGKPAGGRS